MPDRQRPVSNTKLVRKVTFLLADGSEETWDFPPDDRTAYYHVSRNHQTAGRGNPKTVAVWKEHTLHWTSDKWLDPKLQEKIDSMTKPEKDKYGRATGRLIIPG